MQNIFRDLTSLLFFCFLAFQSLQAFDESAGFLEGVPVKKRYLSQNDFLVSHKGIFVLIDGVPRQASRLNSDANGTFVIVADGPEKWQCPRCGRPNNTGSICSSCEWPLWDDDGLSVTHKLLESGTDRL